MKLTLDEYYKAYTDGKVEMEIPLSGPTPIEEVLQRVHIPAWEVGRVMVNGNLIQDISTVILEVDEVNLDAGHGGG